MVAGCRVEEVIGLGDMGVVYRAEELALQRRVALKVIRPEHSEDARFRERFRRESRAAASIDHPNVIPILEAGEEDGVLFITMRLVEGTDLRALLADGGPARAAARRADRPPGRRRAGRRPRARPRAPRHQAGQRPARARRPRLPERLRPRQARQEEAGGLTRQGSIVARAEYVAPEQILEDRVDALTDVYALGCLLYEALTGEPPFVDVARRPAMLAHVNEPPPSPLARRPDLPPRLRRRRAARDGQGSGRALPLGRRPRARRRSSPPASSAGRARSRSSPPGAAAPPRGHARPVARVRACRRRGRRGATAGGRRGEALRWALALGFLALLAVACSSR